LRKAHKAVSQVLLAFDKQLCGRQLAVGQVRPVLYFLLFRHKKSFLPTAKVLIIFHIEASVGIFFIRINPIM